MRRLIRCLLLALMVALLAASVAVAGVQNTRHDMAVMGVAPPGATAQGVCSYCHIPHGAAGSRLFPGVGVSAAGVVAQLCATCHALDSVVTTNTSKRMLDQVTYTNVHKYSEGAVAASPKLEQASNGGTYTPTTLGGPYTGDGVDPIECTSCHNPHTDVNRPFLRVAIASLCQDCHDNREQANDFRNATPNPTGSHVTGAAFDGSTTRPITWPTRLSVALAAGTPTNTTAGARWILGGHRSSGATGGVVCITCHVVHGYDAETPTAGGEAQPPGESALGYALFTSTPAAAPICEACHTTNPGTATNSAHAVNQSDVRGTVTNNILNIDAAMGVGNAIAPSGGYAPGGAIICLSCHDTHFGAVSSPALIDASTGTASGSCQACHLSNTSGDIIAGSVHHPRTGTVPTGMAWTSFSLSPLAVETGIRCLTCHRAHNAQGQGSGTAMTGTQDFLLTSVNYNGTSQPTSAMCVVCHSVTPGVYTATGGTGGTSTALGSHFVTSVATGDAAYLPNRQPAGTDPDPRKITNWAQITGFAFDTARQPYAGNSTGYGQAAGTAGNAWGKWRDVSFSWSTAITTLPSGDAGGGVICESCHSVTNPRWNRLLLGPFTGETQTSGSEANQICVTCHTNAGANPTYGPTGTHPTTTQPVTRPEPDRAVSVLAGVAAGWLGATPAGDLKFSNDTMVCAGCHKVHDADSTGGGYMLRSDVAAAGGSTYGTAPTDKKDLTTDLNYTNLCAGCHPGYR